VNPYEYDLSNGDTIFLGYRPLLDGEVGRSLAWLDLLGPRQLANMETVMLDILRTPQRPGADVSVPAYWLGAISRVRGQR
jgi:hypothetical protein